MLIYQELSLSLLVALGLFVGALIAKNAEEELKDGVKYIKILMMLLFYVTLFLTIQLISKNIILIAFIPTLLILAIFYFPKNLISFSKDYIFLVVLSLCFYLASRFNAYYVLFSIIFFNLICIGSLQYFHKYQSKDRKSMYLSFIAKYSMFVILSVLLIFLKH